MQDAQSKKGIHASAYRNKSSLKKYANKSNPKYTYIRFKLHLM